MSILARFNSGVGHIAAASDNTSRVKTNQFITPAYAATVALQVNFSADTLIQPSVLTGAVTYTVGVGTATTPPYVGDRIVFLLASDSTTRTATFGSGFLPTGTFVLTTGKYATITFIFNGAAWIELGRSITA